MTYYNNKEPFNRSAHRYLAIPMSGNKIETIIK
jgi:hypothetical protein